MAWCWVRKTEPLSLSRKSVFFRQSITGPFTSLRCSRMPASWQALVDRLQHFQCAEIDGIDRRAHQHHVPHGGLFREQVIDGVLDIGALAK